MLCPSTYDDAVCMNAAAEINVLDYQGSYYFADFIFPDFSRQNE